MLKAAFPDIMTLYKLIVDYTGRTPGLTQTMLIGSTHRMRDQRVLEQHDPMMHGKNPDELGKSRSWCLSLSQRIYVTGAA